MSECELIWLSLQAVVQERLQSLSSVRRVTERTRIHKTTNGGSSRLKA